MAKNAFGIKEVADVTFYTIDQFGFPKEPVLVLDTLKVSTVENVAEQSDAKGGKGNANLITWDHSRDITINLQDALLSQRSLHMLYGMDLGNFEEVNGKDCVLFKLPLTAIGALQSNKPFAGSVFINGQEVYAIKVDCFDKYDTPVDLGNFDNGRGSITEISGLGAEYLVAAVELSTLPITISANSFPGVYYIKGSTFARSLETGKDDVFDFIVPKAKVLSETSLTMEADGDPSVLDMKLRAMRDSDGVMMKMKKYDSTVVESGALGDDGNITYTVSKDNTLTISGEGFIDGKVDFEDTSDIVKAPFYDREFDRVIIEEGITSVQRGGLAGLKTRALYLPSSFAGSKNDGVRDLEVKEIHVADIESFMNLGDDELDVNILPNLPVNTVLFENDRHITNIECFKCSRYSLDFLPYITSIKTGFWDIDYVTLRNLEKVEFEEAANSSLSGNTFELCPNLKTIIIHQLEGTYPGAPWGAENAEVIWTGGAR